MEKPGFHLVGKNGGIVKVHSGSNSMRLRACLAHGRMVHGPQWNCRGKQGPG